MARAFKLPKKINGFKLPKKPRKQANRLIARLQGEELEALVAAVLAAVLGHFAARAADDKEPLARRIASAVGSHLKH